MAVREYYYGVRRVATTHRYLKTKLEPFVLRKKEHAKPPDAVIVRESIQPPEELTKVAKQLCEDCNDQESWSEKSVTELPGPGEIQIGDVAIHGDSEGSHYAIILDFPDNVFVWALFFSSKPYGDRFRVATNDEMALAGFAPSRTTYLNLVLRSATSFYSSGIYFPEHRIKDLRQEYLGK